MGKESVVLVSDGSGAAVMGQMTREASPQIAFYAGQIANTELVLKYLHECHAAAVRESKRTRGDGQKYWQAAVQVTACHVKALGKCRAELMKWSRTERATRRESGSKGGS